MSFRNILVATDFSACSKVALRKARALSKEIGAKLTLFHAIAPVSYGPLEQGLFGKDRPKYTLDNYLYEVAEKELRAFLADVPGIDEAKVELREGEPVQVLLDAVEEGGYDLVVMGTHGRTAFAHFLMGSVAERVVRAAPCAVLTVRGPRDDEAD
jgi:universal stress protein A